MPLDASVGCHRHRGFGFVTFKESKGVEASQLHHFRHASGVGRCTGFGFS